MNTCCSSRSHRLTRLFSFGFLDGPQVRLCRPHLREDTTGFGLSHFATIFMNNPSQESVLPGQTPNLRGAKRRSRLIRMTAVSVHFDPT
jgi:hypothetical protein